MTHIRKATQADIPAVTAIYDHILTEEEAGRATVGWIRGVYPTRQTAQDALDAGDLPVLGGGDGAGALGQFQRVHAFEVALALAQPLQHSRHTIARTGAAKFQRLPVEQFDAVLVGLSGCLWRWSVRDGLVELLG